MGLIYKANTGLLKSYPDQTIRVKKALMQTGQGEVDVKAAALTQEEVEIILLKLDQLAQSRQEEAVATMLAEEVDSILAAVRMVKDETKEPFMGIQGLGTSLDITWLRPKDIGDTTMLNKAGTANLGLYGGTSGGVYTWLHSFVAGTAENIIPTQTMIEEAAVVHLGLIDTIDGVPKVNGIIFTLQGVDSPRQSISLNIRNGAGQYALPFARFEKPIIIGPEKQQKVQLIPYITGDSRVELLSLLITKASLLIA